MKNLQDEAQEKAEVDYEIERHQQEIGNFQQEVRFGQDPVLQNYGRHYLPIPQDEPQAAQSVRTKL
jgi:glutamine synthetase